MKEYNRIFFLCGLNMIFYKFLYCAKVVSTTFTFFQVSDQNPKSILRQLQPVCLCSHMNVKDQHWVDMSSWPFYSSMNIKRIYLVWKCNITRDFELRTYNDCLYSVFFCTFLFIYKNQFNPIQNRDKTDRESRKHIKHINLSTWSL